jgi:serine protease Do
VSVGDVILRFDGKALGDERALLRDIATNPAGEKLTLSVRRGAVTRDIAITAQQWPRDQWDMRDAPEMVKHPKIVIPRDLGLRLSTVDHGREQTLGVMGGQKAVMITGVLPNSDAAQQGVAAGDMILRVQGASVDTPADVQSGIDAARSEKRADVLMLIVQKTSSMPGPKWVALRLLSDQS